MEAKRQLKQSSQEEQIRAALDQHWAASDANDFEMEHRIYHDFWAAPALVTNTMRKRALPPITRA